MKKNTFARPPTVNMIATQAMQEHKQMIKGLENRIEVLTHQIRRLSLSETYKLRTIG